MGKKLKRGQKGNVAKYVTRTTAIKRLQLRLADFRRLCILKGIHPREPKKKVKGQNKTYYHVKDINFLAHEPILQSFRDIKAYAKKVKKARAKKNFELARQLESRAPGYKLDHLVRERYPTFVDALRDLDDALCMVHLFATLPADDKHAIPVSMVNMSRRLVLEWQAYCCRTSATRKAFISVKGFYFQAAIQGQMVTWLMPHSISQVLPKDVDYRVMLTFLEFYTTLLQFVLFKLYHGLGLSYPPSVNPELAQASAELAAIMKELGGTQEADIAKRKAAALSVAEMNSRAETLPENLRIAPAPVASETNAPEVDIYGAEDDEDEDDDDDDALVIDSGSDDDDASDAGDPDDAEIDRVLRMRPAAADDDDEDGDDRDDDEGMRAAGGAVASSSEDDDICASLFKGLVVWLGREVPREPLMLLIRSFGGVACWDGVGSPFKEGDEGITHQVVDRPVQGHIHMGREYIQPQWVFDCANFRILVPAHEYAPGKKPPPHLSPFLDYAEEGYVPDYAKSLLKLQESANAARRRAMGMELEGGEEAFVGDAVEENKAAELQEDAAEELYHEELAKELGPSQVATAKRGAKRAPDVETEELEDVQKKALMTRKQRKMFEGLRKKEAEKADRIAELEAKKANIKLKKQVMV